MKTRWSLLLLVSVVSALLTLEPERKGTRVVFRFAARPTSWKLKVLSPVVKRSHSAAVRAGFAELERHLGRATTVR